MRWLDTLDELNDIFQSEYVVADAMRDLIRHHEALVPFSAKQTAYLFYNVRNLQPTSGEDFLERYFVPALESASLCARVGVRAVSVNPLFDLAQNCVYVDGMIRPSGQQGLYVGDMHLSVWHVGDERVVSRVAHDDLRAYAANRDPRGFGSNEHEGVAHVAGWLEGVKEQAWFVHPE